MAPDIVRHIEPECLRVILAAIRSRRAVDVRYQSLTNSRRRAFAPHALAFDGYRWHLRAWCCEREDFRDFVLTRIDEIGYMKPADYDPNDDVEWNTKTMLTCPHPGLSEEQREAIQRDYNMKDGCRDIEVRLSMAYYFITRMNLDLKDLPPLASADRASKSGGRSGGHRASQTSHQGTRCSPKTRKSRSGTLGNLNGHSNHRAQPWQSRRQHLAVCVETRQSPYGPSKSFRGPLNFLAKTGSRRSLSVNRRSEASAQTDEIATAGRSNPPPESD